MFFFGCSDELGYGIIPQSDVPNSVSENETESEREEKTNISSTKSSETPGSTPENLVNSGCETLTLCKSECEDLACIEKCERGTTQHDIVKSKDLITCMIQAQKTCKTRTCELQACQSKIDICGGHISYSCSETYACFEQCNENNPLCMTYCFDLADRDTQSAVDEVADCYNALVKEEDFEKLCVHEINRCNNN